MPEDKVSYLGYLRWENIMTKISLEAARSSAQPKNEIESDDLVQVALMHLLN